MSLTLLLSLMSWSASDVYTRIHSDGGPQVKSSKRAHQNGPASAAIWASVTPFKQTVDLVMVGWLLHRRPCGHLPRQKKKKKVTTSLQTFKIRWDILVELHCAIQRRVNGSQVVPPQTQSVGCQSGLWLLVHAFTGTDRLLRFIYLDLLFCLVSPTSREFSSPAIFTRDLAWGSLKLLLHMHTLTHTHCLFSFFLYAGHSLSLSLSFVCISFPPSTSFFPCSEFG